MGNIKLIKLKRFEGYIIDNNLLYRDIEASTHLSNLLQKSTVYEVVSKLNGSFRFVIETDDCLYFGIDHAGGYSLFYKTEPELEIIINPVENAALSDIQDEQLCALLASGFCYGEKTIFKQIKESLPGVLYSFNKKSKRLTTQEWFSIDFTHQRKSSKEELAELLLSLVPTNFEQTHLALTGGIDSRLLLSLFRKRGVDVKAITYGSAGNPDLKLAQQVAQESQIEHQLFNLDKLNLESYFSGELLKEFFTVGFLGRSLPFESDWVVSNTLQGSAQWMTTGFTSFWLRAPYQDQAPVPDKASLISKVFKAHSQQTLISSSKFKQVIQESIVESMSHFQQADFDSDYDRWNVENRQHKYIINSCNNYRHSNIEVFLPLFDRRLMDFLNYTIREQRLEQKLYMEAIISLIFTREDSYLKNIPSTNPKFNNQIQAKKPTISSWRNLILKFDKHNLNRILRQPNNPMYAIIQSVLLQSPDFLSLKVEEAFPNIRKTISLLYDLNLTNSANHLNWLRTKRVIQLNLLGIEIIGFLVDKFDEVLNNN